jgi:hypothetical protein
MVIDLLNLFGITSDKYPFLVLGVLIIAGVAYIRLAIGNKLSKVKDIVLIIITHLSSKTASRGRLDVGGEYLKDLRD